MADEREEKKLKALKINVFQKIAVTFIVAVAGVVTTLIIIKFFFQLSQQIIRINKFNFFITKFVFQLSDL